MTFSSIICVTLVIHVLFEIVSYEMQFLLQCWCHYRFRDESSPCYSDEMQGAVPKFNFEQIHILDKVEHEASVYDFCKMNQY